MVRILGLLLLAFPLAAHPLPNLRYDRTIDVRLTAAGVSVRYTLEMNEWSMVLDKEGTPTAEETKKILAAPPSQKMAQRIYTAKKAALIADRLLSTVDGQALKFRSEAAPEIHENRTHL